MGKDAARSLAEKAAAKLVEKQAGPLTSLLTKAVQYAPKVESAIGGGASRFGNFYHKALHKKPKWTLFGTGLGLGAANDVASAAGVGIGKWDPAAHAESIDPRVSGWGAAGKAYARPLQSLLAMTGLAGKKAPITAGQPLGPPATPGNLRFGPDGSVHGTQSQDVQMELSPRMQAALEALRGGSDPLSTLRQGLAGAGMDGSGLLGGPSQAQSPKPPAPLPYYADPKFLANASATSPSAGQFTRSF